MRAALALAAPVILIAFAQPGVAETITIPFAPPVDRAFTYLIEQHRPVDGKSARFTSVRNLRFTRAGEGYTLIATLREIDSDAAEHRAAPYRAAMGPLIGLELHFRLDDRGRIVSLDDAEAVWAKVRNGVDAMLAGFPPDSDRYRAAKNVQALFAALSPESRLALLAGEFQPLFLFAGVTVEDGAGRQLRTQAGSPLGRPVPVEGAVRLVERHGGAFGLAEELKGEGVTVAIRYRVSRASGLVESQTRHLTVGGDTLTERRTLTPAR